MLVKFDLRIITQSYIADLWVNESAILGKIMWIRLRHVHRLGETFTFKQILSARDWSSFVHAQVNIFGSLLLLWLVYYVSQHCHERFTWDTLYSLEFAMNYHGKAPDMNAAKQSPKTAAIHVLSPNAMRLEFPTPKTPLRKHGNYSQQPKQLRRRANKSHLEI